MQRKLTYIMALVMLALFTMGASECEPEDAEDKERDAQGSNYTDLQSIQPAESMDYSPTREGLNKWMETWGEEGKISYVYLLAADGTQIGYYVFEGLPVSYCASLTPPDEVYRFGGGGGVTKQAPSMDGVYYSGSQCNQYFGYDATTGSYIEFSAGLGISFFVTEEPLPKQDQEPKALGHTTIEEAEAQ